MNEDRMTGTAKNIGGKLEEGLGRVTGDLKAQVEGAAQQVAGSAQELYGQAKDTAANAARETAETVEDFLRKSIESRPYTTAAIALGIGFLIGRMGRRDHW